MDGKQRRRKNEARFAAQAIVRHAFVGADAARELRPDLKTHGSYAAKLMNDPDVQEQVEAIMNRKEQTAARYKDELWEWFLAPPGDKDVEEKRRTAARILAKPYLDPKMKAVQEQAEGFKLEGFNSETEAALLGKKVQ